MSCANLWKEFLWHVYLRMLSHYWQCIQDSLNHCPMPINADQNSGIDTNVNQCWLMPINSDQWSTSRGISDQCHDFDRHWSRDSWWNAGNNFIFHLVILSSNDCIVLRVWWKVYSLAYPDQILCRKYSLHPGGFSLYAVYTDVPLDRSGLAKNCLT